ncbi:pentatricopeptide repeat-containing protein [Prunus yedoensis var. nudiflora]|uniref:Pentatricopeptide repeat-containing protein n=1 Tax=Prunus yedoensis var. nudiflora TaxID=2094558 RepID=A0A314XGN0_PRUYE|nr:pentatricopeptide repeat-containing protein [Prunus yedoensis var. nudiflora]
MATQMAILARTRTLAKTLNPNPGFKTITTFSFLSQELQLAEPTHPIPSTPLPPNPASGSPLYNENWRNPIPNSSMTQSLLPIGFLNQSPSSRIHALSQTLDVQSLMNVFADWMTSQRWADMKQLFEFWIRSLDKNGKPNKPDVNLYNHYLRANLMTGASPGHMLDLVGHMEDYGVMPNTASFNLVLKSMHQARETDAAEKLLERMLQTGKESPPDDESYDLVVGMLFQTDRIDAALKYIDLTLKSGYMLSMAVFRDCVQGCADKGKLDILVSIIDKCKSMDQNKALCPPWNLCNYIAEVALQVDNSKLAFHALEFMAKWIARGEQARPAVFLSVDEGLLVSALATAARTHRSLQRAFSTLHEYESAYGNSDKEEELFSPFTSLHPLVVACSKGGFETLDSVYYQLENLSRADPPYKSVAALNCIILGCANIWHIERAYQTFDAISSSFELTPDIHSYNALMYAFGKFKQTVEASNVFGHLVSLGVKPNAKSYSLLVDAHLVNKDPKSALSVIDDMVNAGFEPSRETLKKVRRRSLDMPNRYRLASFWFGNLIAKVIHFVLICSFLCNFHPHCILLIVLHQGLAG